MDVSTRRLRYFVAVAEELHFSRAAARLFVSQQSLSKQIHELETELGARLLERSTRRVELTPEGGQFLLACREILQRLDDATREVRAGGVAPHRLGLGFFVLAALELTTPLLTEFERVHPEIRLTMQEFSYRDPTAGLADGSSDLAVVRLPVTVDDLHWEPLFTESRVVAVAASHRLAGRAEITVRELAGERLTRGVDDDPAFRRFWGLSDHLPQPTPAPLATSSHAEELELVAAGRACSITAACVVRFAPRSGVRFVRIVDVPGVTTALAWRGEPTPAARRFVRVAAAVRDREAELVRAIERGAATAPSGTPAWFGPPAR